ncbi:LysE family translocator [Actinoplanes sp. NPDC000266]
MDLGTALLSFAAVGALLTITPGLDTALVLRSALNGGRRPAFFTAAGICLGALTWGAAAAVGVSALLAASTLAYTILRIAGAAYMLWLGARMLIAARRGHAAHPSATGTPPQSARSALTRGALTNLLNPKVGAFYLAVLPQFIPAGASHLTAGLLLASVHVAESMLWFTALILSAAALNRFLRTRRAQRTVDATTGTALIGFGLKLGLSR